MSFHATRNGFDGRKCRFMRHETASTAGNVISCDTKRLRRLEMSFHATQNGFDGRKCHFMRHETASTAGNAILCDTTRPKRPLRVTRNEQKEVRGHFGPPEMSKKRFSAISGHQTRLRRVVRVMPHTAPDVFRPRRASRSGGACRRTSSRRQRLRPAAFRRIGAGSRPACGAVGGHCRAS